MLGSRRENYGCWTSRRFPQVVSRQSSAAARLHYVVIFMALRSEYVRVRKLYPPGRLFVFPAGLVDMDNLSGASGPKHNPFPPARAGSKSDRNGGYGDLSPT